MISDIISVHHFNKAQIVSLMMDGALTTIPPKYSDFVDVLSLKLAAKLSEYTRINNYAIDLVDSKPPCYELIYSLGPIELEILKTYVKINLVNNFIGPSKYAIDTPIFLV